MTDQSDATALPPNKKAEPTKKSAVDTRRQHSDKLLKTKSVPASEPVSGMEHIFLNILRDGKVSLSLEELINLSPPFVKYPRQLITRTRTRPSADPSADHWVHVSSMLIDEVEERVYVASTPKTKV